MKAKFTSILLLLSVMLFSCTHVLADIYSEYQYRENADGGMTIIKYTGSDKTVNIPSEINGKKVTRIGDFAFSQNPYITSVNIPGTVNYIGKGAFYNILNLKSVTIPGSTEIIDDSAFAYCYRLETVNFSGTVGYIGKDAFKSTSFLSNKFKDFDYTGTGSGGVFIAAKNGKYGLVDLDLEIVLPFEYENIVPSDNGSFEVRKNGKWFVLDSKLRPVYYNSEAGIYKDLKLHLEISEILPEKRAINTQTVYHSSFGVAGRKKDLIDPNGNLNIVYEAADSDYICIVRLDKNYRVADTLKIPRELPLFGTAACDDKGNYYILYGAYVDENDKNSENIAIVKYDCKGRKQGKASYTSGEMYLAGTKEPFLAGSASMAISGNILAAHFARVMFKTDDGINHQSSTVLYADINTMSPVEWPIPYASHSLDQYIIPVSGGGFALADRGDGFPRAFVLSRVTPVSLHTFESFHFSECETYQLTHSELGGLAETDAGYILAGSSIKRLTYDPLPDTVTLPRNIFIQIIKKNFMHHEKDGDKLASKGVIRTPDGYGRTSGLKSGGKSHFLPEDITDYGVVWLTDYSGDESATNPKIVKLEHDACAILWEKFIGRNPAGTYYAIVDGTGNIIRTPTLIPNAELTMDRSPLYINGEIVWSVIGKDPQRISVYRLKPGTSEYTILETCNSQTYFIPCDNPENRYIISAWAADEVKRALQLNIPQNAILSDFQRSITREEFCELAVRLYDLLSVKHAENPVSDVFTDTDNPYVLKAYALGIVNGIGGGRFAPEAGITRQEIAVMLERLLHALKVHPAVSGEYRLFADENEIEPWAESAVQLMNKLGIITGIGRNRIAPGNNVTREQAIVMVLRLFETVSGGRTS